jgi:predicted nucleic acid-binding protein
MPPVVYIETSIPSFYFEPRTEPEMVARRLWTRHWWDTARTAFSLVTSAAVVEELSRGSYPTKKSTLALIQHVPRLPMEPAIADIVEVYIAQHVMPTDPVGDALHLALASFHKCDFLLTWNCKHLANANKFGHIKRLNTKLGLHVPSLVTPLELGGEYDAN